MIGGITEEQDLVGSLNISRYPATPHPRWIRSTRHSGACPPLPPVKRSATPAVGNTLTDPTVRIAFLFVRAPKLGDHYEVAQSFSTELNGEPLLFQPAICAGRIAAVLQGREW